MSRASRRRMFILTAAGLLAAVSLLQLPPSAGPDDTVRPGTRSAAAVRVWHDPADRATPATITTDHTPRLAAEDATLQLMRQLALAGDEEGLFRLRSLLADPRSPQGLQMAARLLHTTDLRLRLAGADLLGQYSLTDPAVYRQTLAVLQTETDPAVLVRLLHHLDAPLDAYGKDTDMAVTLHGLLTHPHEEVRAQTILQLLQWDDYAAIEGYLYQALNDPSGEVRLSAATVISLIDTRSSTLKDALQALRNNPRETPDMRQSIDAALSRIDNYNREYSAYQ